MHPGSQSSLIELNILLRAYDRAIERELIDSSAHNNLSICTPRRFSIYFRMFDLAKALHKSLKEGTETMIILPASANSPARRFHD